MAEKKLTPGVVAQKLRDEYLQKIREALRNTEDILDTGNNEITIPCVDCNGDDAYVQICVKVPKGGRDGEPFDGYALADSYKVEKAEKARKTAEREAEKARKKAKDEAERQAKAEARKKREETKKEGV